MTNRTYRLARGRGLFFGTLLVVAPSIHALAGGAVGPMYLATVVLGMAAIGASLAGFSEWRAA